MDKYFGYMPNDFINGEGVSVSFWTAGCPYHCSGCHNSEMWDYDNGHDIPIDLKGQLIKAISANGITRNFSVLGGEPLSEKNLPLVKNVVQSVRSAFPNIKIFLWTGSVIELLQEQRKTNKDLNEILETIDVLIDGPYIQSQRDITLKLRGSKNQRILYKGKDF